MGKYDSLCISRTMTTRREFIVGAAMGASMCSLKALAAGTKPNLRVGILSDTHMNRDRMVTVRKALEFFRDRKVDAVMVAGDISTRGQIQELKQLADVWLEVFPGDKLPDGTPVERLFITGNHDVDGHAHKLLTAKKPLKKAVEDSFYFHREKMWRELFRCEYAPVVKREVKGYVFVLRNWHSRINDKKLKNAGWNGYTAKPEKNPLPEWFAEHGGELPKDKPFFFCQHETPAGTCSWDGKGIFDDGTAYRVLEKYPNAVAFSGHSHFSLLNASTIWQGAFTSIGCSASCGYTFTSPGRANGHAGSGDWRIRPPLTMPPIDFHSCQQGMFMEVYDDRIVLERRDLKNGISLGEDWVIPLGGSAKRPYLVESRRATARPPEFAAGAKVSVRYLPEGFNRIGEKDPQVEVSFPPVNGISVKGPRAFDFLVDAVWKGKDGTRRSASLRVYSPNALMPPSFDVETVTCRFQAETFADRDGGEIAFTVTPLGEFGKNGRAIGVGWKFSENA